MIDLGTPFYGIKTAIERFNKISESISKFEVDKLPENFAGMISEENAVKANAKVIKAQNEMIGSIIDIFA